MVSNPGKTDQILQACLDLIRSGQETVESVLARYPEMEDTLRPELETALWLGKQRSALDPRPGFITTSRRKLTERIQQESALSTLTRHKAKASAWWLRQRKFAWQFTLALVLVVAASVGGVRVTQASQSTLPGDTLYPVKIFWENTSLLLTLSVSGDARLRIEFSQRRLEEIESLAHKERLVDMRVAFDSYVKNINQAIQDLQTLASQHNPQTKTLAISLQSVLTNQSARIRNLSGLVLLGMKNEFDQILSISEVGREAVLMVLGEIDLPVETLGPSLTPSGTITLTLTATQTPGMLSHTVKAPTSTRPLEAEHTYTLSPTDTPAATPSPTLIQPVDTLIPTLTQLPDTSTPTWTRPPAPSSTPIPPTRKPKPPTHTPLPPTVTPKPSLTPTREIPKGL